MEVSGQLNSPDAFTPETEPHLPVELLNVDWKDLRARLDAFKRGSYIAP